MSLIRKLVQGLIGAQDCPSCGHSVAAKETVCATCGCDVASRTKQQRGSPGPALTRRGLALGGFLFLGVVAGAVYYSSVVVGCGQPKIEKAEADAKVIATALSYARRGQPNYCPTVDGLRADGSLSTSASTTDPWGSAFTIGCAGPVVTVTSSGPDRKSATPDDVHATADDAPPAPTSTPFSPYQSRALDPPVVAPSSATGGTTVSATGTIGRPGQTGRAFLFESRADYDESIALVVAKDLDGYKALVRGSAMACTPGTRVRVLESTWTGSRRVRILDGPFAGKSGWVAMEEIRPE